MQPDSGLSPEARAFLAAYPSNTNRIDLDNIEQTRRDAREGFQAAADRASERYDLRFDEVVVGGVDCLQMRSTRGASHGRMLYLFGGGFVVGEPESETPIAGYLAANCGLEIVCPRYRLAPEHPFPAGLDDCRRVYDELIKAGPLVLGGESAGGNLALLVAQGVIALSLIHI